MEYLKRRKYGKITGLAYATRDVLMEAQIQVIIPERQSSRDTEKWRRSARQVYWLADGKRDMRKIAKLLHKSLREVQREVAVLQMDGCLLLRSTRKVLRMNAQALRESPQTKKLFANTNMRRQESSLMATLAAVVAGVERGDDLVPVLHALGKKHKGYGAEIEHYPIVGGVLLATFHIFLGTRFTVEMQEAWEEAFEIISLKMLEGYT